MHGHYRKMASVKRWPLIDRFGCMNILITMQLLVFIVTTLIYRSNRPQAQQSVSSK